MRPLKFRQRVGDRFHYWGVGVDSCTFVGPASGGGVNATNTVHHQFTGFLDKNGKEIYEGDIVTFPNPACRGIVAFGPYEFGAYDTYQRGNGFYLQSSNEAAQGAFDPESVEVIVNIFDKEGGSDEKNG